MRIEKVIAKFSRVCHEVRISPVPYFHVPDHVER